MNAESAPKGAPQTAPQTSLDSVTPTSDVGADDALFTVERNAYGLHLSPIVEHANRDAMRGLDVGRDRRYAGISLVEDASDAQAIAVVDQAIRVVGQTRGEVDANDVRSLLPQVRPALLGARFLAAAKRGDLERIGYVQATHAAGHGRVIAHWRWVR